MIEAILTFLLAIAAVRTYEETDPEKANMGALVVGTVALAAALIGGPLTGAALNPARAFGPAVASGFWTQQYIYWVGPTAGAVAALGLNRYLFERGS